MASTSEIERRRLTEERVRALLAAGSTDAAVEAVVRGCGPEVLGYLLAVLRDEAEANDAFSTWSVMVWEGVTRFRWESSLRTFCYALARHAVGRVLRSPSRRLPHVALSRAPEVEALAQNLRTETRDYLRTAQRDRFAQLRATLDPEDREILLLRASRNLAWDDIARVLADEGEELGPADVARRSAALRKRYERLKETIRRRAGAPVRGTD